MKKIILIGLLITTTFIVSGQQIDDIINAKEAERIEKMLSSDEMRGRKVFTPDIDKAADFIAAEFKAAGIQSMNPNGSYLQDFAMVRAKIINATAIIDGNTIDPKNIAVVSCRPDLKIDQNSGYEVVTIKPGGNLFRDIAAFTQPDKNVLVFVDTSYASGFSRLVSSKRAIFKTENNSVFILGNTLPKIFTIITKSEITEQKLANVVGVLPGKSQSSGPTSKKRELVIFSGHYDHLGIGKPVNGDSIYNGANDNAAGTTAVIMLAKYFKKLNNNERTIVFAAFTAEEVGGYGSQYFSRLLPADKVMAMFNIEMIGTDSKWGKNSAYITGYEKTDMGSMLQKNLEGTGFTFYPDPYPKQNLFYRSDNATLARLGVPAHTISTAKMGTPPEEPFEPNYHKLSDQIETLDMGNMAMIIKAIALSSKGIIAGKETPTRVKIEELR